MHYIVKDTDIYSGEVLEFQSAQEGIVNIIEKGRKKIIYYDGIFLDFFGNILTKVDFHQIDNHFVGLDMEVKENTLYIDEIRPYNNVNDKDLFYAAKAVEYYELKKALIEEGKIIPFPNKVIY